MSGLLGNIFGPKNKPEFFHKYPSYVFQLILPPGINPIFCLSRERERSLPLAQAFCSKQPVWVTDARCSFCSRQRPLPQERQRNQPSPRCPGWCGGSGSRTGSARAGAGTRGTAGALRGTGWSRAGHRKDLRQVRGQERSRRATEEAAIAHAPPAIASPGGLAGCGDARHVFPPHSDERFSWRGSGAAGLSGKAEAVWFHIQYRWPRPPAQRGLV